MHVWRFVWFGCFEAVQNLLQFDTIVVAQVMEIWWNIKVSMKPTSDLVLCGYVLDTLAIVVQFETDVGAQEDAVLDFGASTVN